MNPFTNPKIRKTANNGRINGNICIHTLINDWAMFAIPVARVETSAGSTVTNASDETVAQSASNEIRPIAIDVNIFLI